MKFNTIDRMMLLIRLFYVAASGLLISGGAISLDGQRTGDYLVQAAYIIFAVIISIIITMVLYLRSQKSRLAPASLIVYSINTRVMHSYNWLTCYCSTSVALPSPSPSSSYASATLSFLHS
jgi:hypothetical protein